MRRGRATSRTEIHDARLPRTRGDSSGHTSGHRSALLDGTLDQRMTRDLSREEQTRDTRGLERGIDDRQVPAAIEVRELDLDRADRAFRLATGVSDAATARTTAAWP